MDRRKFLRRAAGWTGLTVVAPAVAIGCGDTRPKFIQEADFNRSLVGKDSFEEQVYGAWEIDDLRRPKGKRYDPYSMVRKEDMADLGPRKDVEPRWVRSFEGNAHYVQVHVPRVMPHLRDRREPQGGLAFIQEIEGAGLVPRQYRVLPELGGSKTCKSYEVMSEDSKMGIDLELLGRDSLKVTLRKGGEPIVLFAKNRSAPLLEVPRFVSVLN